jgi:hypothetical protein
MTDVLVGVLIPYARFVERRERRFRVAREFARIDGQATIDGDALLPDKFIEGDKLQTLPELLGREDESRC